MRTETVIITVIALLLFVSWSIIDNQSYFNLFEARAASDTATATLSVSVNPSITLTIDAGSSVDFGNLSPGSKATGTTRVKSVSNDTITLAIGRDRSSPATTLASAADPSTYNISDTAGGIDVFDGTGASTATWVDGASTGLGFTVWAASENKDTDIWGNGGAEDSGLNEYAALPASASASTAWSTTSSGTKYASVGYILDVPSDQYPTSYEGQVVYTATTTP